MAEYRENVCVLDLLPIGAHRRDWRATLISDGMILVRHPELDALTFLESPRARAAIGSGSVRRHALA
jgi:hypothetical protein